MRIRIIPIIFVFVGLLFGSCKNEESKKASTETNRIEMETPEEDSEFEDEKFLDKIENYILTEYLTERDLRSISNDQRKFQVYEIDLNNDGKKEVFVNFVTSYFCGSGGCSVLLLDDQLKPISKFTVTRTPIYVEESMENGWRVLMVQSEGKWRKLVYKNGSYPSNPSVAEINSDSPTQSAGILFDPDNTDVKTYSF